MTSLHPFQQQILDAITSGARPVPLWTSGRSTGKSWRAKLAREYCEAHGIEVVEINKDGINGYSADIWRDEFQDSWVEGAFTHESKSVWFGFDWAAPEQTTQELTTGELND